MNFNKVIMIGRLTREPELRFANNGTPICNMGLAVNHKYGEGKEDACFVDVVAFNTVAENCNKYLAKGKSILVEGRLQYKAWEAQDGTKRSKHEIVAFSVQFLSGADETEKKKEEYTPSDDVPF